MKRHNRDSNLSELAIRHISAYLDETGTVHNRFIRTDLIPALISSEVSDIDEPTDADEYEKWIHRQIKRLSRYITGENKMPADWILPAIGALPEEYKHKATIELCGMIGTHYVPITLTGLHSDKTQTQSNLANMAKEWGDVLKQSSPALDGKFDENDNPVDVQHYANEVAEAVASLMTELSAIYKGTGIEPAAYRAMRFSPLFNK